MFNPSDLEGEVDHSFFDSDCDDGGKQLEKSLKAEKESPSIPEELGGKQAEVTQGGWSPRTDQTKQLTPAENNKSTGRGESKQNKSHLKEEERSRAPSVSSVACTAENVINNQSVKGEDVDLHSKRPNRTFMTLLAEAKEVNDQDVYSQSPNESEEDELRANAEHSNQGSKWRNKQSPKKRIRNRCTRSPSPTSSEASIDADSESSCCGSKRRSGLDSTSFSKPNKSSSSPRVSGVQVGSVGSWDVPANHTEESDDTVTDVSPLSSPDCSPLQSLDLNHTEAEEEILIEQQQGSVPSSGPSAEHQEEDSDIDECSLTSESQLGAELVFRYPAGRNRKNYSFTNDEVRSIDRENQRLLRELSRLSPGPRPGSTAGRKACVVSPSPLSRVSHSGLNRLREQKRIERENLAFLKRLESVKPTPGLKRSEQLADYQRQVGYLGAPLYPICVSTARKGRSTSKTPSGPRPASSAQHSSRAVSATTTTDSGHTPGPRSKKMSAARPAWC